MIKVAGHVKAMLQRLYVDPSKTQGWKPNYALQDDYMESVYAFEREVHECWMSRGRRRHFRPPSLNDISVPHLLPLLNIDMLQDLQELEYHDMWPGALQDSIDGTLRTLFNSPVMEQTWYWPYHFKARTIQRAWRRCIACPGYMVCRRRLEREHSEECA